MDLLRCSVLISVLLVAIPTDSQVPLVPAATYGVPSDVRQPTRSRLIDEPATPVVSTPPSHPLTPTEREAVEWARGQFRAAGLDLPAVEIAFSADAADCKGEQGIYRGRSGAHSVTICVPDLQGAGIDHRRRRTLLHELAHAWDHATLTDVDRELLLPVLEATDWYDPDAAWDQRGVERLAETLTWGLLAQKRRPLKIDTRCTAIHLDFITITGSDVLGPIDLICQIDKVDPAPHTWGI
jgi:hypothetical protein